MLSFFWSSRSRERPRLQVSLDILFDLIYRPRTRDLQVILGHQSHLNILFPLSYQIACRREPSPSICLHVAINFELVTPRCDSVDSASGCDCFTGSESMNTGNLDELRLTGRRMKRVNDEQSERPKACI